ncbi:MAG: nicotinamide mononucleotide (NMN) deamidase PncC, partial [Enterobacterales bacterium]
MDLTKEISQLKTQLINRRLTICTAESCTGGLIS